MTTMSHSDDLIRDYLPDWSPVQVRRLLGEIELMEKEYPSFKLIVAKNVVTWAGVLTAEGKSQNVAILCDRNFPNRSPYVVPLTDNLDFEDLRHTYHQNSDMTMCLFVAGTGPNGWHPEIRMPEVVRRAQLHFRKTVRGEHQDIHEDWYDPLSRIRCEHLFVLPSQMSRWLQNATARSGTFQYGVLSGKAATVVTQLEPGSHESKEWQAVLGEGINTQQGFWVRDTHAWNAFERLRNGVITLDVFWERLKNRYQIGTNQPLLLVRSTGSDLESYLMNCPICNGTEQKYPQRFLTRVSHLDINKELMSRIPESVSLEALNASSVLLFGCGSLGSAVLHNLLTNGVTKFTLVDPDVVSTANVLRHVATLNDLHRRKTDLLKQYILSKNPSCNVVSVPFDLFAEHFHGFREETAKSTNLIISTVAESIANLLINDYSITHRIPTIFAWVLGTGLGGRVFRVLPGLTPCYQCCSILQERMPDKYARYTSDDDESIPMPEGITYRSPAVPGLAMDIEAVAGIVGRLAIQTLLENQGVKNALDHPLGDHLLWSNHPGWIFDRPYQLIEQHYKRVENCPSCSPQKYEDLGRDETQQLHKDIRRNLAKPLPWKVSQ